jgi:hypothetical protein
MAGSQHDDHNEFYFKQGSCSIILKQGDLLDEKDVNAIVIPTPPLSEPNTDSFAIYKAFCSKADANYRRDIERIREKVSSGPQVLSKNDHGFIFVSSPYFNNPKKACDLLKKTYTSSLELAAKNNYRKVAFPTIGCGISGFPIRDATQVVYQTLENFIKSEKGRQMSEIRLIVFDRHVWPEFTTNFMDFCDYSNSKIKPDKMYELFFKYMVFVSTFLC